MQRAREGGRERGRKRASSGSGAGAHRFLVGIFFI